MIIVGELYCYYCRISVIPKFTRLETYLSPVLFLASIASTEASLLIDDLSTFGNGNFWIIDNRYYLNFPLVAVDMISHKEVINKGGLWTKRHA